MTRQEHEYMSTETIFTMDASSIKFGPGSTAEVGADVADRGLKRIALFTDATVAKTIAYETALKSLIAAGIDIVEYREVRVEPTDASFADAIRFAIETKPDGYVAVGGGSVIDTAKAANLYATWPADLLTYVNAPIGAAQPVPGPLKPLIAIPTTAGTGSETTGVAIFDLLAIHAKTGIANRALRPVLGIVDPINTLSMPTMVTAASALDVLSHAIESFTALPYNERAAADSPKMRPSYQGANPISDIWSSKAMEMVARSLPIVLTDPENIEARGEMMLAATFAGIGFGNAGVHLPHGMSYPVAGMVRDWHPAGYATDHAIVPHGISVILNAPAVFRFTAPSAPARHLEAARLLGADIESATRDDTGEVLANRLIEIMRLTGMPNGLSAIGYGESDLDGLVAGTLPQHRVTKLSPRPASADDLRAIFIDAMSYW
jgi:hydroxyacid-oxoacid transhydrogenase